MNKQEERMVFDMAKQDVPFLRSLELVMHDDRPDFVLKDECGHKIGLEHFRADVYRIQDENNSHVSGGHTILDKSKNEIYQKYHPISAGNTWNDELVKNASNEIAGLIKNALNMRSDYQYESFLDNLHVSIHGRPPKVKGHIQKSKNYPDRESYDLMGFLIEIPVPSFKYCLETLRSRERSFAKSLSCSSDLQELRTDPRQYNRISLHQLIKGLPITNEIWQELNVFEDIDFIIIETYNTEKPQEHYGQYFDKNTPKPKIYPAFSFGLTDRSIANARVEQKDNEITMIFDVEINGYPK